MAQVAWRPPHVVSCRLEKGDVVVTRVRQEHWSLAILLACVWPVKVVFVYFLDCIRDVVEEVVMEWNNRQRYTGWER